MKKLFFICFVLGISSLGKLFGASDDPFAMYHFIGADALANNPNAARLRKIWALPDTKNLRNDVVQKLARTSGKVFNANPNSAALLEPLINDLFAVESFAEFHGNNSSTEFYLAARLNDVRSKLWETNLLKIANAKSQSAKVDDASGWETKLSGARVLKFLRAGKWTFVVIGSEQGASQSAFVKRIKNLAAAASEKNWLEANIDWVKLQSILPMTFSPFKPARTELQIAGRGGEDLRTTVRVIYPEKLDWKPETWEIPIETIRDPLISFTAARDIAPFLKPSKDFQQLKVNPLTHQIYFWAMSQMPFQSYLAMPVKDATNTAKVELPQLAAAFNDDLEKRDGGTLEMATNRVELHWKGLPIIVPFVRPETQKDGHEFLLGGIFPLAPNTNSAPAELFKQIEGRKDVVFYDWEITQARLGQWQMLSQMLPLFSRELVVSPKDPSKKHYIPSRAPEQKWIAAVAPFLGNTVTEVTFKAPNELNVVRKSHIGFNSIELVLLSHWLAHPNFPNVNPFASTPSVQRTLPAPAAPH